MKHIMRFMLLVMLLCLSSVVMAQDIIVKKDGTTIKAKVEKVTDTVIEYKKFTNLTGPTYTIKIADLLAINYENGESETFGESGTPQQSTDQDLGNTGERRLTDAQLLSLAHSRGEKPKQEVKVKTKGVKINKQDPLYKKGKKMRTAGWVVGGAFVVGGAITFISVGCVREWDNMDASAVTSAGIFGAGLAVGIPLICSGQHKINQSRQIQSTSFYQYEIPLGNNASMTADVNLMKDNFTRQYAPALGFHINF